MIYKLNLKDDVTSKSVLELQMASYKIEAEIIGFQELPPLKDTIKSIKESEEIFYGYYINNVLTGIVSFKIMENVLDIHRVAVHPDFFRRGIAEKLINYVEKLENNIVKITVSTGTTNLPAVNLYLKNGYHKKEDIEISPNVYITEFVKNCIR
ncbi:GNAT family N-acetyltransferase [Alkaliphilus transvaalensis]|uniref:GNAT family N-acetyltransferase n=1 Tax=Alkaliphilus transvaalensis TaxID=114628 RepID=UPI00047BB956|nr:GNAT family N-acetyltransferase [Alkaliphilus transvaalensis]